MPLVRWNNSFSVGIYVFDLEHMQLLALVNNLFDAMVSGLDEKKILSILNGVTDFAEGHFAHEEEFFQITGYAGGEAHRSEHRHLLNEIQWFKESAIDTDARTVAINLSGFLTMWFTEHTVGLDREFCGHLRKLGIR